MTQTAAIVFEAPHTLAVADVALHEPVPGDVVVEVAHSGISTGTERLLWSGRMPPFPGLGYPLVPGYEAVGTVVEGRGPAAKRVGDSVFVPGARCFDGVRALFGASAGTLVVPAERVVRIDPSLGADGALLALLATAHHALEGGLPDLVVGHGVLGRLIARLCMARGAAPRVWETATARTAGATGYEVLHPDADERADYGRILDVSGDANLLDTLVARLAPGGEIVLAGFYAERLSFAFPPAFMKEARLRIAAEWRPEDLMAATRLASDGAVDLSGLLTHRRQVAQADTAYRTAFGDPDCLKMVIDWS